MNLSYGITYSFIYDAINDDNMRSSDDSISWKIPETGLFLRLWIQKYYDTYYLLLLIFTLTVKK